jgi:hypothetical protein
MSNQTPVGSFNGAKNILHFSTGVCGFHLQKQYTLQHQLSSAEHLFNCRSFHHSFCLFPTSQSIMAEAVPACAVPALTPFIGKRGMKALGSRAVEVRLLQLLPTVASISTHYVQHRGSNVSGFAEKMMAKMGWEK